MDVYLPVCDTIKPALAVLADDQPWVASSGTQSLMWYRVPARAQRHGRSSKLEQVTTFVIVDHPAHAGLERLRKFRGWTDNWDAEGSKAPDPAALDFASKVFGLLAVHRLPEVTLAADGRPMFVYGHPLAGEVVVTGPSTIDYFFADDNSPEGESVTLEAETLPSALVSYLRSKV